MRPALAAFVGAAALLVLALALIEHRERAGPYDVPLASADVPVVVQGSYHAQPRGDEMFGVCLAPPCAARTEIDLRVTGLPVGPYEAALLGPTGERRIGLLQETWLDGQDGHLLRWDVREDHTDKQALVVRLAGQQVLELAVGPAAAPLEFDLRLQAQWSMPGVEGVPVHAAEIGGAEISTVVKARLPVSPPEGWTLVAHLEGRQGTHTLPLEAGPGSLVLDARIERLPLEHQDRVVVALLPSGATGPGFPVAAAVFTHSE